MKLVNYDFLLDFVNRAVEVKEVLATRTDPSLFEKPLPANWDSMSQGEKVIHLADIGEYMGAARVLIYNRRPVVGKKIKRLKKMFKALGIELVSFHPIQRSDDLERDVSRLDNAIQSLLEKNIKGFTNTSFVIIGENIGEDFMNGYIRHAERMPNVVNVVGFGILDHLNHWDIRMEWEV